MRKYGFLYCAIASQIILLGATFALADTVYDMAANFSASQNPNGVWTYAGAITPGGTRLLYTNAFTFDNLNFWNNNPSLDTNFGSPWVAHNGSVTAQNVGGFFELQPGQLAVAPGPGESMVQFRAPAAGVYVVNATFSDPGLPGTVATEDVHVTDGSGGTILNFNSFLGLNGIGPVTSMPQATVHLEAGDLIVLLVGNGGNGGSGDHAAISATIDYQGIAAPLPSASWAGALLLLTFALISMVRRASSLKASRTC